jgi:DNA-directed RNA polymerase beta' subunit
LLNRAPTLHRFGFQSFLPKCIFGKAIQLHPLVCAGFNADFDGDQIRVHLPLSKDVQRESLRLIIPGAQFFSPADGRRVYAPGQDIVLGRYYRTVKRIKHFFNHPLYSRCKVQHLGSIKKFRTPMVFYKRGELLEIFITDKIELSDESWFCCTDKVYGNNNSCWERRISQRGVEFKFRVDYRELSAYKLTKISVGQLIFSSFCSIKF